MTWRRTQVPAVSFGSRFRGWGVSDVVVVPIRRFGYWTPGELEVASKNHYALQFSNQSPRLDVLHRTQLSIPPRILSCELHLVSPQHPHRADAQPGVLL